MTTKQLITFAKLLDKEHPNAKVIISADDEGNAYGQIDTDYSMIDDETIAIYPMDTFTI